MTFPTSQMPPSYGPSKPEKLSWVTIPLIIQMVFGALSVIFLPFLIPVFKAIISDPSFATSMNESGSTAVDPKTVLAFISSFIWVIEFFNVAMLVLYFLTYRGVQQGKGWARIVAIIVFILGLANIPVGTLLGIFGLIGAFDAQVTAYCNR
jgi:hypothetical protein